MIGTLSSAFAQSRPATLHGTVTTADHQPAAAVTVRLLQAGKSTITAESGDFIFRGVNPGTDTLEISLVGYENIIKPVRIEAGTTASINLQLTLSGRQLSAVIVSADASLFVRHSSDDVSKMPLSNLENAQVYTTITKDLMTEQGNFTLDQAVTNVPGITKLWDATSRPGDGGSYFTSRGFALQSTLRNGVAGNITSNIDAANIERIEVIKGPSATLFGSTLTSFGGLINRITKKPYDHFGGEVSYTGGNFAYNRFSADVNTPLDSAHDLLMRVNTAYTNQGSFQDNGFSKSIVIAPSISYRASDRLSFLLDAEFYAGEATTPQILFFNTNVAGLGVSSADKLNVGYKRSYMANDLVTHPGNTNFFGQMNYNLSSDWTAQTNVSITNSRSNGLQPYFYLTAGDSLLQRMVWAPNGTENAIEAQENLVGRFRIGSLRNRLVVGLDYYYDHPNIVYQEYLGGASETEDYFDQVNLKGNIPNYLSFNKTKVDSAFATSPAASPYYNISTINTYSAYASDVLNITDNLIAAAALRVDHFVNKGNYSLTDGTTSGGYNQTALSPKFGLVYQVVPGNVSLFANYQNSFQNENGVDYNNKPFKPEQANQFEAGVKLDGWQGKISGTISYYDIKVSNVIRSYPTNPNLSIQDGTQLSKGLEAELIVAPVAGLQIVAGYSYNDSKYTRADSDVLGRRPTTAGSPNTASLWVSYHLGPEKTKGWGIAAGGNYASDNKIQNSVSMGVFTLPTYTLVNAAIFYEAARWRFALNGKNLGNQKYWIGYTTVDPQPLRSVNATVTMKF